jgi:hypothetical protein
MDDLKFQPNYYIDAVVMVMFYALSVMVVTNGYVLEGDQAT